MPLLMCHENLCSFLTRGRHHGVQRSTSFTRVKGLTQGHIAVMRQNWNLHPGSVAFALNHCTTLHRQLTNK